MPNEAADAYCAGAALGRGFLLPGYPVSVQLNKAAW